MATNESAKDSRGFTLIEMAVAMALVGIMATISMTAFSAYKKSADLKGTVREVAGILRNIQVRAVTEATTYQCSFTSTTLEIYRDANYPPSAATRVRTFTISGSNIQFHDIDFDHDLPGPAYPDSNCVFYARGSADPGELNVKRLDSGKSYEIKIEGLTARVSYQS